MKNSVLSKLLAGIGMMIGLMFSVACSSGDDDVDPTPDPEPKSETEQLIQTYLEPGSEERPSWTMDISLYQQFEQTMAMQVVPQYFLKDYVGDGDLVAAFIGDQVRAVTAPEKTAGHYYFPLVIAGNGSEGTLIVKYYCSKLHRIYTSLVKYKFDADYRPTDLGEPLELIFDWDIYYFYEED